MTSIHFKYQQSVNFATNLRLLVLIKERKVHTLLNICQSIIPDAIYSFSLLLGYSNTSLAPYMTVFNKFVTELKKANFMDRKLKSG